MLLSREYLIFSPLASIVAFKKTSKTLATFPYKVHRHGTPFLIDLGLQGHQTWMAVSFNLCPQNDPYGIIKSIQMWGT